MSGGKKLIEVALPLKDINEITQKELNSYFGRPSTLHLWWSRKPLSVARAVLFASLVDDPSARPDLFPSLEAQDEERARLSDLLLKLITWENSNNERVLAEARAEIRNSMGENKIEFFDPFAGGGSIPLEAQRLGLITQAADLNPVAVMINKATLEIPPKFAQKPPVNPQSLRNNYEGAKWVRAIGLTEDIAHYSQLLKMMAFDRIGALYPRIKLPGQEGSVLESSVIAWLWARTVKCPNPACGCQAPLVNSFALSKKKGAEFYVFPVHDNGVFTYQIREGQPTLNGTVNHQGAKCLACQSPISLAYIREEGSANRLGNDLIAIVTKNNNKTVYLPPDLLQEKMARQPEPEDAPEAELPEKALGFRLYKYGFLKYKNIFTNRQLILLTTLCSLVKDIQLIVEKDAIASGWAADGLGLAEGGSGAKSYSQAIAVYLSFIIDKIALYHSSICSWHSTREILGNTFAKRSLPMIWNYAEGNPFSDSSGSIEVITKWIIESVKNFPASGAADIRLSDAQIPDNSLNNVVISTDPPYYDNIGYSDLSDFFYVWLRLSLRNIYESVFSRIMTPKIEELIASPFRFEGDKKKAKAFFESGMRQVFSNLSTYSSADYPVTIYYAFKQSESEGRSEGREIASTGWEAMLSALIEAGFTITATWPILTEKNNRPLSLGVNGLSSSIVLVCRKRSSDVGAISRRDFLISLSSELAPAIMELQRINISPVDLAQAAIGPGMAIFSRHAKVLDPNGSSMSVREALALINKELDKYFSAQEESLDKASSFCVSLFSQVGFNSISFSQADILARAKNLSVADLAKMKVVESKKGQVRLLEPGEYSDQVNPAESNVWFLTHLLIHALNTGGLSACAKIAQIVDLSASFNLARTLAYRLYIISDHNKWNQLATTYNCLVYSWPDIQAKYIELKLANQTEDLKLF
ncbi:MAG: DUF1156 domain-containing protein [Deltaproteobacteria bacterium]|jgi:putative DNA methylase|nr:DUF1156 domain-containing protein [Deltaproteobacteria bacterium]